MEPEQEEPIPPVTVAEVHEFLEERAAQRRGPQPDALPMSWQATTLQLWASLTQTAGRIEQTPAPDRQIRSPASDNAAQAQPAGLGAHQPATGRRADNAGGRPVLTGPWSNSAATHPANGAASSSGHGKWPIHDDAGGGSPSEQASLDDLPPEPISMIAEHVPGEDTGRLRQANRRLDAAFTQEDQAASHLVGQAQRAMFAERGGHIEFTGDRLTVFNLFRDAVTGVELPLTCRVAPLAGLIRKIENLNAGSELWALNQILDAVNAARFPIECSAPLLAELMRQLDYLELIELIQPDP